MLDHVKKLPIWDQVRLLRHRMRERAKERRGRLYCTICNQQLLSESEIIAGQCDNQKQCYYDYAVTQVP